MSWNFDLKNQNQSNYSDQSQFLAISCNSLEAREKSRVQGGIGFGFASHWLKNWRESFKPITKRSNRNHVITFDSHLKTALSTYLIPYSSVLVPHQHGNTAVSFATKSLVRLLITFVRLSREMCMDIAGTVTQIQRYIKTDRCIYRPCDLRESREDSFLVATMLLTSQLY